VSTFPHPLTSPWESKDGERGRAFAAERAESTDTGDEYGDCGWNALGCPIIIIVTPCDDEDGVRSGEKREEERREGGGGRGGGGGAGERDDDSLDDGEGENDDVSSFDGDFCSAAR
jgi:hypothetical protein